MNATTRRSNLPKSMAGQTYCYDKDTVGMPVEIHPSPSIWQDVPEIHRHDGTPGSCSCQLGSRGSTYTRTIGF